MIGHFLKTGRQVLVPAHKAQFSTELYERERVMPLM